MECVSLRAAWREEEIPLLKECRVKSYNVMRFHQNARVSTKQVLLTSKEKLRPWTPIFFHRKGEQTHATSFDHECLRELFSPEKKLTVVLRKKSMLPDDVYFYHCFDGYRPKVSLTGSALVENCLKSYGIHYCMSQYDLVRMAFLRSVKVNGDKVPYFYSPELSVLLRHCYERISLDRKWKNFFPEGMSCFEEEFSSEFLFPKGSVRRWSVCDIHDYFDENDVRLFVGDVFLRGVLVPQEESDDPNINHGEVFFAMLAALQELCGVKQKWWNFLSRKRTNALP